MKVKEEMQKFRSLNSAELNAELAATISKISSEARETRQNDKRKNIWRRLKKNQARILTLINERQQK